MRVALRRILLWGTLAAVSAAGVAYMMWPRPIPVDLAVVAEGPLRVTVDEEGRTRIRDIYEVSAPVAGRLLRIGLRAGDDVEADRTLIAELQPIDPGFRDLRTEAELRAAVQAAIAGLDLARANVERSYAQLAFAEADLQRAEQLAGRGTVSTRQLEEAQLAVRTAKAEVAQAEATAEMRKHELERSRSLLLSPVDAIGRRGDCPCVPVYSPVDGKVLRVLQESEVVVEAGATLVEIGDPRNLEIVIDLLSADAVKVEPGQRVILESWGGQSALNGVVTRIEPFGFTKVSALGIEEQRVNVRVALTDPSEAYARLAHGFRVEAAIVQWEADRVLKLPLTALFRRDGQWTVFAVVDGRARERRVEIGHGNGLEVEILSGLAAGDTVIVHPSDRVVDGIAVVERQLER
ncbi:efflux RND transporter periplasmic adaptor subunit [Polymorphum gilvum]|uniref:Efflux transporter, RND family, MFP subunit n=1 Tax=Polymorphum gilvum (strain LMG 25793 / CGMCC 1.9160 / SL003B-26A1) TaxID=991905 RepID=F2IYL3_POLGS|nr:HlyD family efflux transporter periplasmic adaptor subunit [Polymorphum gilvum]ADZ69460.1 Efflux transporter, RND family, MFP subunit [Polymorphum gilvum SL003B-26A1]